MSAPFSPLEFVRRREAEREAKRQERLSIERDLLLRGAAAGADGRKLSGATPTVESSFVQAAEEISKAVKKRQSQGQEQLQEREQQGLLANLARGPRTPQAQQAFQIGLQPFAGNPEFLRNLGTLIQQPVPTEAPPTEFERGVANLNRILAAAQQGDPGALLTLQRLQSLATEQGGFGIEFDPVTGRPIFAGVGGRRGGGLSAAQQLGLVEGAQNIESARSGIRRMVGSLREDATRGGFAARIRNAIESGVGLVESLDEFAGTRVLSDLLKRGESTARDLFLDPEADSSVRSFAERALGFRGDVSVLEQEQLFLSLALAEATRGSGRLTNEALRRFLSITNFKDVRGPGVVARKLEAIDKVLQERQEQFRQRGQFFGVGTPQGAPQAPLPSLLGAPPPGPSSPERPAVRRFRVDDSGRVRGAR